jgi:hypothetical protein
VSERQKKGSILLAAYAVISLALQGLSFLLVGPERFLAVARLTHGRTFVVSGIAPSLSTLWYLGMELFHRFSVYTTILVAGAPYLLIAPLYIRLSRYPEVLVRFFSVYVCEGLQCFSGGWSLKLFFLRPTTGWHILAHGNSLSTPWHFVQLEYWL